MAWLKNGTRLSMVMVSVVALGCGRTDEPGRTDAGDSGHGKSDTPPDLAEVSGLDARPDVAADEAPADAPAPDGPAERTAEVSPDSSVGTDGTLGGGDGIADGWVIEWDLPRVDTRDAQPSEYFPGGPPDVAAEVAVDGAADVNPSDTRRPDSDGTQCVYNHAYGSLYVPKVFDFSVIQPDGFSLSCATRFNTDGGSGSAIWPGPQTGQISGRVVAVTASEIQVDTCAGGGGCSPTVYRFAPTAPGLSLPAIPVGRHITVSWWLYYGGWSCGRMLLLSDDVAADAGTGAPAAVWLAGADSTLTAQLDLPFSFTRQELFCNPDPAASRGCGGSDVPPDDYAFVFAPETGEPSLTLATGQSGTLAMTVGLGVIQHLKVYTVRCFMTGGCDDYSNWAWWATGHAGVSGNPD